MHLLPEPRQRLGEGEGEVEDDGRRAHHHRDGHGQVRRAHARQLRVRPGQRRADGRAGGVGLQRDLGHGAGGGVEEGPAVDGLGAHGDQHQRQVPLAAVRLRRRRRRRKGSETPPETASRGARIQETCWRDRLRIMAVAMVVMAVMAALGRRWAALRDHVGKMGRRPLESSFRSRFLVSEFPIAFPRFRSSDRVSEKWAGGSSVSVPTLYVSRTAGRAVAKRRRTRRRL